VKALDMITFLSDFGWAGGYVAACEATIARISPSSRIFHVSHDVPAGDVGGAALVLARVAPLYPEAVHLAVVDPGVGTSRRPLALSTSRGDYLVGPDNGLLPDAGAALGGFVDGWSLDMGKVRSLANLRSEGVSTTFHARDLFAPASALLATGVDPLCLGDPLDLGSLVRLPPVSTHPGDLGISAPVIEIDRFGNVGLGLPFAELPPAKGAENNFVVQPTADGSPEWTARAVQTYADLGAGELGLIRDSWGQTALVLNGAGAAEFLGVRPGAMVKLKPAGKVRQ
jgi:S-adenosylmethionine hydrolase